MDSNGRREIQVVVSGRRQRDRAIAADVAPAMSPLERDHHVAERAAQGLPPHLEDPTVAARVAALLIPDATIKSEGAKKASGAETTCRYSKQSRSKAGRPGPVFNQDAGAAVAELDVESAQVNAVLVELRAGVAEPLLEVV